MEVAPKSAKKAWWRCSKGHEWQAVISSRSDGNGNVKSFGTGSDYSKNDLDWINNFLGEYAGKQDIDTEFED